MSDDEKAVRLETAAAFGGPLMRALGIDPGTVTGFRITCIGGDFPTVEVHRLIREGEGEVVQGLIEQFELRLKSEAPLPRADLPTEVVPLSSLCAVRLRSGAEPSAGPA